MKNGVSNAVGQYWWTRARSISRRRWRRRRSIILLIWALAIGFLVWGDVPTIALLLAGSAVVVASGLFLLWRETGGR